MLPHAPIPYHTAEKQRSQLVCTCLPGLCNIEGLVGELAPSVPTSNEGDRSQLASIINIVSQLTTYCIARLRLGVIASNHN